MISVDSNEAGVYSYIMNMDYLVSGVRPERGSESAFRRDADNTLLIVKANLAAILSRAPGLPLVIHYPPQCHHKW